MFNKIFKRNVTIDRLLVQENLSTVFYIFAFVFCIPVFIYLLLSILCLCGLFTSSNLMSYNVTDAPSLRWAVLCSRPLKSIF